MSFLVKVIRITNVRGQQVSISKRVDGKVSIEVFAPFPSAPKNGQMHYDPGTNTMWYYDRNGWEEAGKNLLPTNNPIDYNDSNTARASGIAVMGFQVMIRPGMAAGDVTAVGDVIFVSPLTAEAMNKEITAGSGPLMRKVVMLAHNMTNDPTYTLDASMLNVMQGYRARRD